jgi:hypothetical protein
VFRSLINDAKSAAGAVIGKYAIRASVAVPFLVAAGFGTAAITLMLVDRFGAIAAYGMMGGGFAAIGLLASLVVAVKEQEDVVADVQADKTDTAGVTSDATAQAAVQLPMALLGTLLTTPMGPGVAMGGAKMVMRNLPLVILVALLGLLFWPSAPDAAAGPQTAEPDADEALPETVARDWQPMKNGADHHVP